MNTRRNEHERRLKWRFRIQRELRYKLLDGDTVTARGAGQTVDISSAGVAFDTDTALRTGAYVELSISWPAMLSGDLPLRLVVFGRVVRVEGRRAAALIHKYEFRIQGASRNKTMAAEEPAVLRRWTGDQLPATVSSSLPSADPHRFNA